MQAVIYYAAVRPNAKDRPLTADRDSIVEASHDLPRSAIVQIVYQSLVEALALLDDAGEKLAAAHVVAAVDTLEAQIDESQRIGHAKEPGPLIDRMAVGMVDHLGARAVEVARTQMAAAKGQTMVVWALIAGRIDRLATDRS